MVLQFEGVVHPPPPRSNSRKNASDLSRAEISNTLMAGTPLLVEHEAGTNCGNVLTSWEGRKGELRVLASVKNKDVERKIHNGTLRGLSLGTGMVTDTSGNVLFRGQQELSVCEEGLRNGTWIHEINGKRVYEKADFSASALARNLSASLITRARHRLERGVGELALPTQMAEPAAHAGTEVPVTATDVAESQVSMEVFNAMKAQLESRNQELADARAQGAVFEERERARVGGWQTDVKDLLKEFMDRGDPELKADVAPLEPWASEYAGKQDIIAQRPLARVMCEASKTLKRVREEASVNRDAAAALSNTMKELDGMKGERDNLKQRLDEMSKLAEERQDGMIKLQEELTKAGLLSDKHDFSKILNREKPAADAAAAVASTVGDSKPVENGIKTETSQASRGGNSNKSANPLEADPLLAMCMRGQGNSRIIHSSTNHQLLGNNGQAGDVFAALRAY